MGIDLMARLSKDSYGVGGHQCPGCGSHIASNIILRTLTHYDNIHLEGNACGFGSATWPTGDRYRGGSQLGMTGANIIGLVESLKVQGITDKKLVIVTGEGSAMCTGLGHALHAFMRGGPFTLIIMNNEGFQEAGNHLTSRSPLGASDKSILKGKETAAGQIPLLVGIAGAKYVATSTYGYPEDLVTKVEQALEHQPSFVEVLASCETGWRYPTEMSVELSRLAVRTDAYPLWEWLNEEGQIRFHRTVPLAERLPVTEYTHYQRRFRHLTEADVAAINENIDRQADMLNRMEQAFG